jgi:hypothetical protein
MARKAPPELAPSRHDRFELRFLTVSRTVDGLWIGSTEHEPEPSLQRIEAALKLIRDHDRPRYNRLKVDLSRIWVRILPSAVGSYNRTLRACELDDRFIQSEATTLEEIATAIVHEATHARLMAWGIGYDEGERARVEAVCIRRELAFAKRLPDNALITDQAARLLTLCDDDAYWTDAQRAIQLVEGTTERLRGLGFSERSIRFVVGIRDALDRLRALRRSSISPT